MAGKEEEKGPGSRAAQSRGEREREQMGRGDEMQKRVGIPIKTAEELKCLQHR